MATNYPSDDDTVVLSVSASAVRVTVRLQRGWRARWYLDRTTGEPTAPCFVISGRCQQPGAGVEQAGRPDRHREAVDRLLRRARRDGQRGLPTRQEKRPQGPGRHRLHDEVIRLYVEQKMTPSQIAQKLGISVDTVATIRRRAGVPSHRKLRQKEKAAQQAEQQRAEHERRTAPTLIPGNPFADDDDEPWATS